MNSKFHLAYRPEIDGLRAIAVMAVVLYHFGVPGLTGGFIGVDVFFVISGYLIGGILWAELISNGKINLGRFYMRRVRRLAPAFFAVAIASTIASWFILLPFEFRSFGKELIASSVWLSNVLFYREAGYFDIGSENRVLLHTWSLSVEEQFYIFLPFFLILLTRLRARPGTVLFILVGAWAGSLAACVALTPDHPVATFYLFPYRAWELLTGVVLAIILRQFGPGRGLAALLSWGGLILIAVSILMVRSAGFPGWQAILPVVATAALIAGTSIGEPSKNPVARLLSLRAVTFVGLISYSLYLWHWPVLILSRYWRGGYGSALEGLFWLVLVFALSALSWRFIEQPVRQARELRAGWLLTGVVAAGGATMGLGALAYVTNGLADRFPPEVRVHITASSGFLQDTSRCFRSEKGPLAGIETCAIGPEGKPEFLIWGDSHLRAQMDGLAMAANEAARPGLIIWHAGCPPLFGLDKTETAATPDQDRACRLDNDKIRAALRQFDGIKRLLLVGRWTYYAEGSGVGRDAHNLIRMSAAAGSGLPAAADQADLFGAALHRTVAELRSEGYAVFLLRQVPELPQYDSPEIAREMAHGKLTEAEAAKLATVSLEELTERTRRAEAPIDQLADAGQIKLIDPWPRLCSGACSGMQEGRSFYFDNNHLTYVGAVAMRDLFLPFLSGDAEGGRS
ncbi:acyltransferase family protein [Paracoccus sp. MBLB3053]|uniref:Acyltransferase family protein n=1 Tax=Paracoccus aurantius TaxID=3073814 RepID=A0ABU2HUL4_9RHOB|nr:acyltransferase family protein [Paracoccus sp. MBLB3053]MDS9468745.1 acyltransferase family protein [Paracoccus sp. MBLB3053]